MSKYFASNPLVVDAPPHGGLHHTAERYVLTVMKKLTLFLFALVLASCNIDTDKIINPNETLQVYIYGTELSVEEYLLNPGDEKYKKFISWVRNNKEGWSSTPATYVPKILISGKSFTINFMDNIVLINYADGQFTKKIDPTEYEFLKK
jgi:hypothetical protein